MLHREPNRNSANGIIGWLSTSPETMSPKARPYQLTSAQGRHLRRDFIVISTWFTSKTERSPTRNMGILDFREINEADGRYPSLQKNISLAIQLPEISIRLIFYLIICIFRRNSMITCQNSTRNSVRKVIMYRLILFD